MAPYGHNLQKVRDPAAHDEQAEGPEESLVGKILPGAAKNPHESRGNHYIRQADKKIADHRSPKQTAVTRKAVPMRQKARAQKRA